MAPRASFSFLPAAGRSSFGHECASVSPNAGECALPPEKAHAGGLERGGVPGGGHGGERLGLERVKFGEHGGRKTGCGTGETELREFKELTELGQVIGWPLRRTQATSCGMLVGLRLLGRTGRSSPKM